MQDFETIMKPDSMLQMTKTEEFFVKLPDETFQEVKSLQEGGKGHSLMEARSLAKSMLRADFCILDYVDVLDSQGELVERLKREEVEPS